MSISVRLKEERLRLGLSQTAFAELAGATKSAQIKWERGTSAPTAPALASWAEAGADALYILTGKRTPERLPPDDEIIDEQLDEIERELLEPQRISLESPEKAEARALRQAAMSLESIRLYEDPNAEQLVRLEALQELIDDRSKRELFRATKYSETRQQREDTEALLSTWFQGWPYQPDHTVMNRLVMLSMDFNVPYKLLVELSNEIAIDVEEQQSADRVIEIDEREQRKQAEKKSG